MTSHYVLLGRTSAVIYLTVQFSAQTVGCKQMVKCGPLTVALFMCTTGLDEDSNACCARFEDSRHSCSCSEHRVILCVDFPP